MFHKNDPDEYHAVSGVECYAHRGGTSCTSENVFH